MEGKDGGWESDAKGRDGSRAATIVNFAHNSKFTIYEISR